MWVCVKEYSYIRICHTSYIKMACIHSVLTATRTCASNVGSSIAIHLLSTNVEHFLDKINVLP